MFHIYEEHANTRGIVMKSTLFVLKVFDFRLIFIMSAFLDVLTVRARLLFYPKRHFTRGVLKRFLISAGGLKEREKSRLREHGAKY